MTTVSLTLSQALDIALAAYRAGKFIEAEQICQKLLSAAPDSVAAIHLLAVIHASLGKNDAALAGYDRVLSLRPDFVEALNNRGALLKELKRFDQALASYDRALSLRPDYVEVLNNRGSLLLELGRHDEALEIYDRVLALRPDFVAALNNRGIALYELKRFDEALASYDRALLIWPDYVDALNNRGNTLNKLGRHNEALVSYDDVLAVQPRQVEALYNRGGVLRKLERFDEALASYDGALGLRPDYVDALTSRGATLHDLKRFDEALASCDGALASRPDDAEALINRGDTLHHLKRYDEALASYDRALASRPDETRALTNRGVTLHDLMRYDEALASHERALAVQPDHVAGLNNRGVTLHKLGRLDESLASYDHALAIRPDYAEAFTNRGVTLHDLMRFDEALASYDRALILRPDCADTHFFEGLSKLLTGDFSRGWIEYEWRRNRSTGFSKRDFPQPLWLGREEIAGKTILLHSEQGFGDTIQFCRYAPLVAARGARVIVEVEQPLQDLLTSLAGATQIIARGSALPDFDFHCPLLSLPLAFDTRLETIPSSTPYLRSPMQNPPDRNTRLETGPRPRIGLAWSGNAEHTRDRERSIRLRTLLPLLDVEATFVSLQKQVRAADTETLKECGNILHFGDELEDFSHTAALMSQLDLVISVDTSIAHLAGALGKPVWVLLTYVPDWRWLLDRDDSPWYPTARLFRQNNFRDWDYVIARVRDALVKFVESKRSSLE
jgi:tetratricopeptide (TPR) repeat protein